ncbi:17038_t:CDS:2 [Dentiscutata erythropus]|uniref:17038_t:CDS:1 n=1 Tax=Dentiscutata erythropus TaxID=1348616 RepID=A0A9N9D386_9GLOM|nr:17038_t:CDS:2 [Dentiscutata erythropus]
MFKDLLDLFKSWASRRILSVSSYETIYKNWDVEFDYEKPFISKALREVLHLSKEQPSLEQIEKDIKDLKRKIFDLKKDIKSLDKNIE